MTHFNPITGEMQDRPWTENPPQVPPEDPREHVLQFRGRADGQLDAYCRHPECPFRLVVEADRDAPHLLVLDLEHTK